MESRTALLKEMLALHFHPREGAAYWLEKQQRLGISVPQEIRDFEQLYLLGPMDLEALRRRPVEDFVPRRFHGKRPLILAETGGATGIPKTTAWFEEDFEKAFIRPFLTVTEETRKGWPEDGHWLWLGPSGPHIIGKAARRIARLTTGSDAFSIDFDPRWYRRLGGATLAGRRYLEHVLEQAERIIRQQNIRYLFTTPAVLEPLLERMTEQERDAVRFIYLGGMPVTDQQMARFATDCPRSEILNGYGNTLFGVCHGIGGGYYTQSERTVPQVIQLDESLTDEERLRRLVPYGERGQVVMHRLTESSLLLNVMERDSAVRLAPLEQGGADGIGEPQPLQQHGFKVVNGIY